MVFKITQREKQDQFYWYVNDLIKKARPDYSGPHTYEAWLGDNPDGKIKKWFDEEVERYISTEQLDADWREYHRNPSAATLNQACQHCEENILKNDLVVIESQQVAAFADAIREVLPKQPRGPVDVDSYPQWVDYTQAVALLEALTGTRYKRDSVRKMAYRKKLLRHPEMRGRISRVSCIQFADRHPNKRN